MDLLCGNKAFAAHLISANLESSTIPKPHVLVARATSIGLMRLAQQAAAASGLRTFALMVHFGPVVIYNCVAILTNPVIET